MEVIIKPDPVSVSKEAIRYFETQLEVKPASVLGLATGATPLGLYQELARLSSADLIDFSRATTFNLDEYVGLGAEHPRSYRHYMNEHFFSRIDIPSASTHVPNGMAPDIRQHCLDYEAAIRRAGGIDLQLLGLGGEGHIGFNEPTSSLSSRTRIKTLTPRTIADNAPHFGGEAGVPRHVITMGIGTIMEARQVVILVIGEAKAAAVAAMVEGPLTADCPASILQMHVHCTAIMDEAAASGLKRREYYRWAYDNKPAWQRI